MQTNATVTIKTTGITYDEDTGNRTEGTPTTILSDYPCLYSQNRGSRRTSYSNGQREYVSASDSLLIPNAADKNIVVGYTAIVTCSGITQSYIIENPILSQGLFESIWQTDIERIKNGPY